jgi:F-type H+-transporting ATPase subunit delta
VKISKKARRDAKQLFNDCKVDGLLNEGRVREAVSAVAARKPRGYLGILHQFQRLVRLEVERRTARVQSAVVLSPTLKTSVQANLTRRHGEGLQFEFVQNPALVGGMRIQVGSDVYDGSVHARLANLEENLTR